MKLFNVYRNGGNIFKKKKAIITKEEIVVDANIQEDLTGSNVFHETVRKSKYGHERKGVKTNNIKFMIK